MTLSPAERYAASVKKTRHPETLKFSETIEFSLDEFQIAGCHALEDGHSVLVAAPTGAGKTIVGEFAAHLAIASGTKCFYTTPIKALSNQKYQDLCEAFGDERVGLLTGDTSFNSEAQIVVMTTEVLRNMIYAGSNTLTNLRYVVMDEVHYLADKFRGAVWEEILIHLPESVTLAALSATVSNAEEFGDWLQTVRGETKVIVSEVRPVPLYQHVLFGNRLLDLFVDGGKVNPEILKLEKESIRQVRTKYSAGSNKNKSQTWGEKDRLTPAMRPMNRSDIIEKLDREGLLPAITFIFSRAGCDAAVKQCLTNGLRLTNAEERSEIRKIISEKIGNLPEEDLYILGFHEWADALERGIAAHHAGLLPAFKETVEELFQQGYIKAVFATETLALGINMPARTVVLEKLSKWNGESHVSITPGEYTQLTGRAGRRGIDIEGNAVILWTREIDSGLASGLASTRTYPLKSSFKPTYNMTINLISQMGVDRARRSLESSFAQFQADKAVVGLMKQINRNNDAINKIAADVECHLGDFLQYASYRSQIRELERSADFKSKRTRMRVEEEIDGLRREMRHHPCHGCSEREDHARYTERMDRLVRENRGLVERVETRTNVIVRRFNKVLQVLEKLGYIHGQEISAPGQLLSKIYGETDLLIAESIRSGLLQNLAPQDLVSVLSAFQFEARRDAEPKIPKGAVSEILPEIVDMWRKIYDVEVDFGLEPMRAPDLGFCWAAHRWASGNSLSAILKGSELTVGDFVRSMKQVIDLLKQLAIASPELAPTVEAALTRVDRGVIAYAGALT